MKYNRNIELLISIILVFCAFITWYLFAYRQYQITLEEEYSRIYIDVVRNKNSIRVENVPSHVYFRVDGDFMQEGELELKE